MKNFASLSRLVMAPLTMSIPALGALTVGENVGWRELLVLGLLGLCAHIFGFVLNDIIDFRLDKKIPSHQKHPLVTGEITHKQAWLFVLLQVPTALFLYKFLLNGTHSATLLLGGSFGISVIYNLWSKWGSLPRIFPELALALSVGLLAIVGALYKTTTLPINSIVFAFTLTIILLLLNSVPNHLKDIKTDQEFGVISFVLSVGSKFSGEDKIIVSPKLVSYSAFLQTIISFCMIALFYFYQPSLLKSAIIILLTIYAGLHLRMILKMDSLVQLRRSIPFLSGFYNYFALGLFVIDKAPKSIIVFYSFFVLALFALPFGLAYRIWRNRYQLIN